MKQVNNKMAGALIFVGATQFILCMLIAECLYPGYSVSGNYISDLGKLGEVSAPVFNASVVVLGLTVVAGAYFLRQTIANKVFLSLLILCGIGAIGVGIFPEDFGPIHFAVSLIAFLFGALSAIASYKFQKAPLSYFAVVLGVVSLVALVLFGQGIYLGLGKGGMERMIAYPILLWAIGFGGYLIKE
ncbi:DUF998 domain-containing protein [Candidatus Bathyarchaeota archaeon]|nr:DUF998 domain-containing protein [Candidatus Bathyarchaeota archaeon]MBS7637062.1 DUF998 domain-containing protein [Candidatus Bathyarchaeota archaeon]